jgi:hypothetical protein
MKSLTGLKKILPVTLFRGLVAAVRKPPVSVTLKDVPKAARDFEKIKFSESRP